MSFNLQLFGGRGSGSGGGGGIGTRDTLNLSPNPALNLGRARITQRAENDFRATYREARDFASHRLERGEDLAFTISTIQSEDAPIYSLQALKGIQAKINTERNNVNRSAKAGVINENTAAIRHAALNAIQRGVNKEYDFLKEIGKVK